MSEVQVSYEKKLNSSRAFLTLVLCSLVAQAISLWDWVPYVLAVSLAFGVGFTIEYWIPPKPPMGFSKWMFRLVSILMLWLLGLWIIPKLLSRWIWEPVAYGAPVLIVVLGSYWIPPLYPIKRSEALWKWVLVSVGFSVLTGLAVYYTPEP